MNPLFYDKVYISQSENDYLWLSTTTDCTDNSSFEEISSTKNILTYKAVDDYNNGSYIGDIIKDENVARKYADLIMSNTLKKDINDYKVIDVSWDNDEDLWIVNYSIDEMVLGGDVTIGISKDDGEVDRIIFGE
ncbi:MAG: NTF2 fold immunity protein [Ruminococcus sp.]